MATGFVGSTLANNVAARQRLSAVRKHLNLEGPMAPQSGLRNPMPDNGPPPAAVVGPQVEAVQQASAPPPGGIMLRPPSETDQKPVQEPVAGQPFARPLPPEEQSQMMSMVQNFLDQHGPQQQQLMDVEKQKAQAAPMTSPLVGEFTRAMGRAPTPSEMKVLQAQDQLSQQLGRLPTPDELKAQLGVNNASAPSPV